MANVSSNQSWWDSEMANELRQLFYNQYQNQQSVLNFLGGKMRAMVQNPTGFAPAALAAMRAQATDNISRNYQHAEQALNAQERQRGGADLPSGVNSQLDAGLLNQQAQQQAGAQNEITQANEQLRQQNYWRGVDVLNGTATERNPQSYLSGALDASAGVGGLANAATQANQSGFGSQLESGLAKSLTGNSSAEQGLGAALIGG